MENERLKEKCGELESTVKMKMSLEEIMGNCTLEEKCNDYEEALEGLSKKVDSKVGKVEGVISEYSHSHADRLILLCPVINEYL